MLYKYSIASVMCLWPVMIMGLSVPTRYSSLNWSNSANHGHQIKLSVPGSLSDWVCDSLGPRWQCIPEPLHKWWHQFLSHGINGKRYCCMSRWNTSSTLTSSTMICWGQLLTSSYRSDMLCYLYCANTSDYVSSSSDFESLLLHSTCFWERKTSAPLESNSLESNACWWQFQTVILGLLLLFGFHFLCLCHSFFLGHGNLLVLTLILLILYCDA